MENQSQGQGIFNALISIHIEERLHQHALIHVLSERLSVSSELLEREVQEWYTEHQADLVPVVHQELAARLAGFGVRI